MTTIYVIQNDYGYRLNFTLKDADGVAINLTSGTPVAFKAQLETGTALAVNGNITVGTPTTGECYYTVAQGDFANVGKHYAEIQITFTDKIITLDDIVVVVRPELPRAG